MQIDNQLEDSLQDMGGVLELPKDPILLYDFGRILVMKKTSSTGGGKKLPPEKIPAFLWDVKLSNFGWIGDNFVCHDYGQFYNMIHYPKRMKKARWFEGQ